MVVAAMARRTVASHRYHNFFFQHFHPHDHNHDKPSPDTLGILAFDAAKTMCRLVSLYKSLTDDEISRLRNDIIKSKGVVYLNSKDEYFLLNLACAERLEDLNMAAVNVSRFGRKCADLGLHGFDLVYADLKLGLIDLEKLEFKNRNVLKIIEKMEKLVSSTGNLHHAMESLSELESSGKRIQRWQSLGIQHGARTNMDYFNDRIKAQRKQVRHYKESSLWNQTFDKAVGLMARIVCIVYARIFCIFGPHMSDDMSCFNKKHARSVFEDCCGCIQHKELNQSNRWVFDINEKVMGMQVQSFMSGPMPKISKRGIIRAHNSPLCSPTAAAATAVFAGDSSTGIGQNNRVFKMAAATTVGGSGLSFRYANMILFAERCLHSPVTIGEEAREALYEMLPERLKGKVKGKLRWHWKRGEAEDEGDGRLLAEGWREAVEELMEWLSPVAHDTVKWQAERNLEKQKLETKPTVLLLQTLHYSDLEKAEAAIVEVLVGLSCIYWYQNFRSSSQPKSKR